MVNDFIFGFENNFSWNINSLRSFLFLFHIMVALKMVNSTLKVYFIKSFLSYIADTIFSSSLHNWRYTKWKTYIVKI